MYNKLFTKILDSSIWLEPTPTRIVWITFLAAMDEMGMTRFASVRNVALRARVSVEEAKAAIACLEAPDPDSGNPDHEGRRLERVPGGWLVINAEDHRRQVTKFIQQEQTRERVRRHRERLKNGNGPVTAVTHGNGQPLQMAECNAPVTPSEAVSRSEKNQKKKRATHVVPPTKPADPRVKEFLTWFQAEYRLRRRGADYFVKWDKHGALIKQLLGATELPRLKRLAQVLLTEKTDEDFIVQTDRGIEILALKFNWLSDRLAAWDATQTRKSAN